MYLCKIYIKKAEEIVFSKTIFYGSVMQEKNTKGRLTYDNERNFKNLSGYEGKRLFWQTTTD